jgi:hypothetical protein
MPPGNHVELSRQATGQAPSMTSSPASDVPRCRDAETASKKVLPAKTYLCRWVVHGLVHARSNCGPQAGPHPHGKVLVMHTAEGVTGMATHEDVDPDRSGFDARHARPERLRRARVDTRDRGSAGTWHNGTAGQLFARPASAREPDDDGIRSSGPQSGSALPPPAERPDRAAARATVLGHGRWTPSHAPEGHPGTCVEALGRQRQAQYQQRFRQ